MCRWHFIFVWFNNYFCQMKYKHFMSTDQLWIISFFSPQKAKEVVYQCFLGLFFHPSIDPMCMHAKLFQSCPTLCDPMDCGPLVSSVQGILQTRILESVATSSSRGPSLPRDQTHISLSCLNWQAGSLTLVPPGMPHWSNTHTCTHASIYPSTIFWIGQRLLNKF